MSDSTFTIKPFPHIRQATIDLLDAASRKHMIHGLIEVDVTKPRQRLRAIKQKTGETVERSVEGRKEVVPTIIRAANRKSVQEIHQEIRQAQYKKVAEAGVFRAIQWYLAIPFFIRRFFFRILDRAPHQMKKNGGTVMVTSIGMFGRGAGWGIPVPSHTLNVTVGGIVTRPCLIDAQLEEREYLCLTVSFDHDIIDGAPAARFIQRFKDLVASGSGLFDVK
ncbi:MAG: 2-oxo acid dehydrogenase subunit E2 [Anaerolineales bacterium]